MTRYEIKMVKMIKKYIVLLGFLVFYNVGVNAQYNTRCDCGFQGGNKRQYDACNATIDISPLKQSGSTFTDYRIDAKVDTKQCSIVYYNIHPREGQEAFGGDWNDNGQINVVDGSHSGILDGSIYKSMPDIQIKDCVVCKDSRYQSSEDSKNQVGSISKNRQQQCSVKHTDIAGDSGTYTGQCLNGKPHGSGRVDYYNGDQYVGEYKNGRMHGQGAYTWSNGDQYVGEYKNDKKHGQGTQTWPEGARYVGAYKNDKRHGQGAQTWPNGDRYVGEYRDDRMNGQGTQTWPNGDQYVGEFRNSQKHGYGTYTWSNGDSWSGQFRNEKQVK